MSIAKLLSEHLYDRESYNFVSRFISILEKYGDYFYNVLKTVEKSQRVLFLQKLINNKCLKEFFRSNVLFDHSAKVVIKDLVYNYLRNMGVFGDYLFNYSPDLTIEDVEKIINAEIFCGEEVLKEISFVPSGFSTYISSFVFTTFGESFTPSYSVVMCPSYDEEKMNEFCHKNISVRKLSFYNSINIDKIDAVDINKIDEIDAVKIEQDAVEPVDIDKIDEIDAVEIEQDAVEPVDINKIDEVKPVEIDEVKSVEIEQDEVEPVDIDKIDEVEIDAVEPIDDIDEVKIDKPKKNKKSKSRRSRKSKKSKKSEKPEVEEEKVDIVMFSVEEEKETVDTMFEQFMILFLQMNLAGTNFISLSPSNESILLHVSLNDTIVGELFELIDKERKSKSKFLSGLLSVFTQNLKMLIYFLYVHNISILRGCYNKIKRIVMVNQTRKDVFGQHYVVASNFCEFVYSMFVLYISQKSSPNRIMTFELKDKEVLSIEEYSVLHSLFVSMSKNCNQMIMLNFGYDFYKNFLALNQRAIAQYEKAMIKDVSEFKLFMTYMFIDQSEVEKEFKSIYGDHSENIFSLTLYSNIYYLMKWKKLSLERYRKTFTEDDLYNFLFVACSVIEIYRTKISSSAVIAMAMSTSLFDKHFTVTNSKNEKARNYFIKSDLIICDVKTIDEFAVVPVSSYKPEERVYAHSIRYKGVNYVSKNGFMIEIYDSCVSIISYLQIALKYELLKGKFYMLNPVEVIDEFYVNISVSDSAYKST